MRRYISYLAMCAALLAGVGVASSPMISSMNSDLSYGEGQTLYFKASNYVADSSVGNYEDFLTIDDVYEDKPAIEHLANIIRDRLDSWELSEYSVVTEGYDTIAVSLRATGTGGVPDANQYAYLQDYLSFSGQDYELDVSYVADEGESPYKESWGTMLADQVAEIRYIPQGSYSIPVVIMPIKNEGSNYSDFKDLIKYCEDNTDTPTGEEGEDTSALKTCNVVLWANKSEGDTYEGARGDNADANIASKIVVERSAANSVYYAEGDEDQETPYLQILPNSAAIGENSFDASQSKAAYEAAVHLQAKLNASSFGDYRLNFTHMEETPASVEALINRSSIKTPAFSRTLLAVVITAVFSLAFMVLFNRILGVAQAMSLAVTTFASFATFVAFGAQFNIAALLGLALVALLSSFGTQYYAFKLKDELYKGRTLKKAHSEAAKKSVWPTVDAGLVAIIIGVFVYLFAGDLASKLGTMLVLGGVFSIACNLILFRIAAYLLTSDSSMQKIFPAQLGVDAAKIPDLLKEEKQTYFGPYEKHQFGKGKLWVAIFAGLMVLGGIGTMSAFGAINNGNVYNDAASRAEYTVLRLEVQSDNATTISYAPLANVAAISSSDASEGGDPFHSVKLGGKYLADSIESLELSSSSHSVYDSDDELTRYYFYYSARFATHYDLLNDDKSEKTYPVSVYEGSSWVEKEITLQEAVQEALELFASDVSMFTVSVNNVVPEVGAPYLGRITLGLGVGLAVAMVYLILRFRPSKGIVAAVLSSVGAYISLAFFAITRTPVTPIVSLGAVATAVTALLLALYLLNEDKDLFKESREKDKSELSSRIAMLERSSSLAAGPMFILALLAFYFAIAFLGAGPVAFSYPYLSWALGIAFSLALVLVLLPFASSLLMKLLGKIRFKPIRRKKKQEGGQLMKKKRSAEPEEAIFIGIND